MQVFSSISERLFFQLPPRARRRFGAGGYCGGSGGACGIPHVLRLRSAPAPHARRNSARFAATTVAPTGVDQTKDTVSPTQKHETDVTAAQRVTPKKL